MNNNVIYMKDPSDWIVMNMVKNHIKVLKQENKQGQYDNDIARNEAALRSFHEDIKERSAAVAIAA
jgi:hypothetical protein